MSSSASNSGFLPLPMPGTAAWRTRIAAIFSSANTHVLLAFWLFGQYCVTSRGLEALS